MAARFEVAYRNGVRDVPGEKLRARLRADTGKDVMVHVVDVYTVDAGLSADVVERLKTDVFVDPVLQQGYAGAPVLFDADWVIEVGFKPGVTDNVGRTAREVIKAVSDHPFGEDEAVYTSRMFFMKGPLTKEEIVKITEGILANTLINRYAFKNMDEYRRDGGMGTSVPRVTSGHKPVVESFDLTMDILELLKINRERTWALSRDELVTIRDYFQREEVVRQRTAAGLTAPPLLFENSPGS